MDALGINPVLLIAQVISFLILFFVLKKFLYGFIQKALEERRSSIQKTFSDKEELERRLENLEKEQDKKRKEMHALSKKIESEAKQAGEDIKKEIVAKAALEGERELNKAKERIGQEVINSKKELAAEAKALAKSIVEKVLAEQTTNSKWQKDELNKSIKGLTDHETE